MNIHRCIFVFKDDDTEGRADMAGDEWQVVDEDGAVKVSVETIREASRTQRRSPKGVALREAAHRNEDEGREVFKAVRKGI